MEVWLPHATSNRYGRKAGEQTFSRPHRANTEPKTHRRAFLDARTDLFQEPSMTSAANEGIQLQSLRCSSVTTHELRMCRKPKRAIRKTLWVLIPET